MNQQKLTKELCALLLALATAFGAQAQQPEDQAAARAAFVARVKAEQELIKGSVGWFRIGSEGQWLFENIRNGIGNDGLYIVKDGDGFLLFTIEEPEKDPVGSVSRDGIITILNHSELKGASLPERWPVDKKLKKLKVPQRGELIVKRGGSPRSKKFLPKGLLATFLLTRAGDLVRLPDLASSEENVLWAVKRDDGSVDFVHSGPLRSGVYLHVTAERKIKFQQDNIRGASDGLWPFYIINTGRPAVPDVKGLFIPSEPAKALQMEVLEDGHILIDAPVQED